MWGDWRRLALAAVAALIIAVAGTASLKAQAPDAKAGAKKAPPNEAGGEAEGHGGEAKRKRQDPDEAQRTIDAAFQQLGAGKSAEAAHALTRVLNGGGLPPAIMAKALLYRGIAYRQLKKPAQAIADLTSALWLKGGLGEADRGDALQQRAAAYQEAGLADSAEPIAPAVPNAARGPRTASAGAAAETAQPPPSSSFWSNPFAGWFGGSSPAPASPPAQPSTTASIETPPQARAAPQPGPQTSAWTSTTQMRGGSGSAGESAAAAKPEGRFRIQIGMVRTQAEAQALSERVRREHPDALSTREAEIDEAVVGNMGSFYRVRVGPFASAQQGQAACAKLKGSGIDCLVVTP
jgi:hypothetical protein